MRTTPKCKVLSQSILHRLMWLCRTLKYSGKLFGKYIIEKPIGEGRYGLCFLARSDIGDKIVIKKFKQSILKKYSERNVNEAVILSKLKDKRIRIFRSYKLEGFYGFVLEFKHRYTVKDLFLNISTNLQAKNFLT